jgi:hypothetical protein
MGAMEDVEAITDTAESAASQATTGIGKVDWSGGVPTHDEYWEAMKERERMARLAAWRHLEKLGSVAGGSDASVSERG